MQRSHRRSTKVCMRCRKRKTKCDFKFPSCTACKLARIACVGFDPATKEAVPRSLVRSLEARVAELEAQTLAFRAAPQNVPTSIAALIGRATVSAGIPPVASFLSPRTKISSCLIFQPSCPPLAVIRGARHGKGSANGKRIVKSPEAGMGTGTVTGATPRSGSAATPRTPSTTSSPVLTNTPPAKYCTNTIIDLDSIPPQAIERIVENYAEMHLPQYPCISRAMLEDIMDRTRRGADRSHFESFVLFIVLALSTMTLTWKDDDQARRASEAFYNSALTHLQQLDDDSDLQALQVSLLLAHYAHMCPERVDNWTCIANAVRIVLNLGLYRGGGSESQSPSSPSSWQRVELFWVTYGMERSLCTNLRLPLSIPEEAITAETNWDGGLDNAAGGTTAATSAHELHKKAVSSQIRKYRKLETEVHRVLHLEEDVAKVQPGLRDALTGDAPTVSDWMLDLNTRMLAWYAEAQQFAAYNMLEFQHIMYNHLRARVHRPTPRLRARSPSDRQIVLDSARLLIDDYGGQEVRRRLFYPWHGVHILFETAVIALDACWEARVGGRGIGDLEDSASGFDDQSHFGEASFASGMDRPLFADQPLPSVVHMLEVDLPACLQLIAHIGERWPAAAACTKRLRPLVDKVRTELVGGGRHGDNAAVETEIGEEINSLLFSDRPLVWNRMKHEQRLGGLGNGHRSTAGGLGGTKGGADAGSRGGEAGEASHLVGGLGPGSSLAGGGEYLVDFPLVEEDMQLFQWDADWSVMPPERTMGESIDTLTASSLLDLAGQGPSTVDL